MDTSTGQNTKLILTPTINHLEPTASFSSFHFVYDTGRFTNQGRTKRGAQNILFDLFGWSRVTMKYTKVLSLVGLVGFVDRLVHSNML